MASGYNSGKFRKFLKILLYNEKVFKGHIYMNNIEKFVKIQINLVVVNFIQFENFQQ